MVHPAHSTSSAPCPRRWPGCAGTCSARTTGAALPAETVRTAARTHPRLHDGGWLDNAAYEAPERLLAEVPEPLYPVDGEPVIAVPVGDAVAGLRAQVRQRVWLVQQLCDAMALRTVNGLTRARFAVRRGTA